MIKLIIMDVWSNMTNNFPKYATDAYSAIGDWFYPIMFLSIIGYIYAYMRSATAAMVAIMITFGIYGYFFIDEVELTLFLYVVVILIFVALITLTIINPRK